MMLKINNLLVGLLLIAVALTGFSYAEKQGDYVFIYDVMSEEKIDISIYYRTGLYYIYTNSRYPLSQLLIRKQQPMFWSREAILKELNSEQTLLRELTNRQVYYEMRSVDDSPQILQKIIENEPKFSEKMQYDGSYVSRDGLLNEEFIGYFELSNQLYTVSITNKSYAVNKLWGLTIEIIKGFDPSPSSYEELLEEASKQPQPPL